MYRIIKRVLGLILFRMPILRKVSWAVFLRYRLREGGDLQGLLLSAGHGLDHCLTRGFLPTGEMLAKTEAIISLLRKRKIPLSDGGLWVLGLLAASNYRLNVNFRDGLAQKASLSGAVQSGVKDAIPEQFVQLKDIITMRRSVRVWRRDSVSDAVIKTIISAATWAPCSCNRQSWKVLVLRGDDEKDFVTRFYTAGHNHFWKASPVVLVIMMSASAYNRGDAHYAYLDAGAFIQNLLLAAHSLGLGACWIGFIAWDSLGVIQIPTKDKDAFYNRFACSRDLVPVSIIPIGYSSKLPRPPPRTDVENVILTSDCGHLNNT